MLPLLDLSRPKDHVVAQELQNRERVLKRLAGRHVGRGGDGLVERVFREVARTVGAVPDVVVEDGKVEREPEARGVCRLERDEGVLVG